jgi:CubicO group peptidase (beta-lactamase class C family)
MGRLNGGALDGQELSEVSDFRGDDNGPYRAEAGRCPQLLLLSGDGFAFGYGFGLRTDPGNALPPPGSFGEIKWDGATGVYIVVDRAEDMFFVLTEVAPSGRMHVQVTRCCENPIAAGRL